MKIATVTVSVIVSERGRELRPTEAVKESENVNQNGKQSIGLLGISPEDSAFYHKI